MTTISTNERVLLAQAVHKLGADWINVATLLRNHLDATGLASKYTAQFCFDTFNQLLTDASIPLKKALEPNDDTVKQLAQSLYGIRLQEISAGLRFAQKQQTEIRAEIQAVESGQRDQDLLIKLRPDLRERVTVPKTAPTRSRKSRQTNQSAESVEDDEAVDDVAVEALLTGRSTAPLVSPLLETLKALPPTTPRLDVVPESDPILESEEPTKKKALRSSGRQSTRGKVDMEESDQASDLDGESVVRQSRRQDTAGEGIEEEEEDGTSKPSGSVPPRSEDATNGGEGESASSSRRTSRKNATGATSKKGATALKRKAGEQASPPPAASEKGSKRQRTEERGLTPRPALSEKDEKVAAARFKKGMNGLMNTMIDSPNAGPFQAPVRKNEAPGYSIAIKRPLCFRDVTRRIKEGTITTPEEVSRDVYLVFANAVQFNALDSEMARQARELVAAFDVQLGLFYTQQQSTE